MDTWLVALFGVFGGLATSGGFWAYLQSRDKKNTATTRLLLGLAHDRIIFLGTGFIERGWISKDEYEDYLKYLVEPYSEFGGNGLAERIVQDVKKLPMRAHPYGTNTTTTTVVPIQVIEEKP